MAEPKDVKSIFLAASEKPAAERAAYLDEATAGDTSLRARVEALLQAHDNPDSFLRKPVADFGQTMDFTSAEAPLPEKAGTQIGPYKLLEQIGEGGMGVVFMAEQFQPIRRRVALKVIKPGMDTRQVIARFEAERQALAMMDHPNIAKVFDAGTTASGRPYFVMELVRGISITDYCDHAKLSTADRVWPRSEFFQNVA
jgi:serine/threonine protein kinase